MQVGAGRCEHGYISQGAPGAPWTLSLWVLSEPPQNLSRSDVPPPYVFTSERGGGGGERSSRRKRAANEEKVMGSGPQRELRLCNT